jgi:3-methylcrotonyl-CoA carboxylase alpha subunit
MKARRRFRREREGEPAQEIEVEIRSATQAWVKTPDGEASAELARLPDGRTSIVLPSGRQITGRTALRPGGRAETWIGARRLALHLSDPLRDPVGENGGPGGGAADIRARIPGRVVDVRVSAGDLVGSGTTLVVLEAMKMQNEIQAEFDARVVAVECAAGSTVEAGAILVRLEPAPSGDPGPI